MVSRYSNELNAFREGIENRVAQHRDKTDAINKALDIDPKRRYKEVSEFIYELNRPSSDFKPDHNTAWIDRDPVRFWQSVSTALLVVVLSLILNDYW